MMPSFKNLRGTDGEFVVAIMNCLQRPFRSRDPRVDCSEEGVTIRVQQMISRLRSCSRSGSKFVQYSQADVRKLIRLLRKCGHDRYADKIEELHHRFSHTKPAPARSNELKFRCAYDAYYLMTTYTEQKPTTTKNGAFQEITALFYNAITGQAADREYMDRACRLVIKAVKESTRLAHARKARAVAERKNVIATFKTQQEAIEWAKKNGYSLRAHDQGKVATPTRRKT
jgi:hypothetical protein